MRAKILVTAILLAPSVSSYAKEALPDGDLLEFIASLEDIDGELLDPIEINDMLNTSTIQNNTTRDKIFQGNTTQENSNE